MATLSSMRRRFLGALVLFSVSLQAAAAGTLVKLWELDLSRWNKTSAENADRFSVAALSFSPDGKRIALTSTNKKKNDGKLASILLVIQVGAGAGDVKSFEAAQGGDLAEWSPSGDAIVVNGVLIQLEDGMRCEMPDTTRFISGDQLIGIKRAGRSLTSSQLTVYDKSCHRVNAWETSERWDTLDVSIQRHLLLMEKPHEENLLVDPDDGRVVLKWSAGTWPVWDGPGGKFADSGAALCNDLSVEDAPKGQTLRCWKTDTGELIANAPADYATGPFVTSKNSTRVVFSEVGYVRGVIRDWDVHPYKGAVVWDYASGKKLASWRPATQTWYELVHRPVSPF
jgi:dipeptidyl aminopeptidase/acylaminoacyl peptidase